MPESNLGRLSTQNYAAAMRRIRSSCCDLLSAPMVKASRTPGDNAYLMASSWEGRIILPFYSFELLAEGRQLLLHAPQLSL